MVRRIKGERETPAREARSRSKERQHAVQDQVVRWQQLQGQRWVAATDEAPEPGRAPVPDTWNVDDGTRMLIWHHNSRRTKLFVPPENMPLSGEVGQLPMQEEDFWMLSSWPNKRTVHWPLSGRAKQCLATSYRPRSSSWNLRWQHQPKREDEDEHDRPTRPRPTRTISKWATSGSNRDSWNGDVPGKLLREQLPEAKRLTLWWKQSSPQNLNQLKDPWRPCRKKIPLWW